MAERIAQKIRDDESVVGDVIGFVLADILGGAVLRKFDLDTPARRIADGIVDHASEARIIIEAAKKYPEARVYFGILAARALLVGGANALHLAITGEVTNGHATQRATNLATAAFGLIAVTGNKKATHVAGIVAAGVGIATAIPHITTIGKRHDTGVRKL